MIIEGLESKVAREFGTDALFHLTAALTEINWFCMLSFRKALEDSEMLIEKTVNLEKINEARLLLYQELFEPLEMPRDSQEQLETPGVEHYFVCTLSTESDIKRWRNQFNAYAR